MAGRRPGESTPGESTPGDSTPGGPLRVLVTRPAGQEAGLVDSLRAAGHTVFHQPLLVLQPLAELPDGQRRHLLDLDRYGHVIFVSGNAVRYGMAQIDNYWPQLPVGINWYAVGTTTAQSLERHGVRAVAPDDDMTSEGLLSLPGLQAVSNHRVLIVKGEGGRSVLEQTLLDRGARVDLLECYRRCRPALAPGVLAQRLAGWRIDVILISSGEGLENLVALLSTEETTNFRDTCLIVPSIRVARAAEAAGFAAVVVAPNASDAAMLQALGEWNRASGE